MNPTEDMKEIVYCQNWQVHWITMFTGLQIPWKMVNYQFVPICKCYLFSEWALHFVVDVNFSRACIITSPKNVAQRENN